MTTCLFTNSPSGACIPHVSTLQSFLPTADSQECQMGLISSQTVRVSKYSTGFHGLCWIMFILRIYCNSEISAGVSVTNLGNLKIACPLSCLCLFSSELWCVLPGIPSILFEGCNFSFILVSCWTTVVFCIRLFLKTYQVFFMVLVWLSRQTKLSFVIWIWASD